MAAHGKKTDAPEQTNTTAPAPAAGSPEAHDAQMHADMAAHGKKTDAPEQTNTTALTSNQTSQLGDSAPAKKAAASKNKQVDQKMNKQNKKAAVTKAGKATPHRDAWDTLAAANRVVESLREKHVEAAKAFAKEAEAYARTGGHPHDHKKDKKVPGSLEIATATKNVANLRYQRALAQAELLKRDAEEMAQKAVDQDKPTAAGKKVQAKGDKADKKKGGKSPDDKVATKLVKKAKVQEKDALQGYTKFKKKAEKVKQMERKLRAKKTVLRAIAAKSNQAEVLHAKAEHIKGQTNEVQIKTNQVAENVISQRNSALALEHVALKAKHQKKMYLLNQKLKKANKDPVVEKKMAKDVANAKSAERGAAIAKKKALADHNTAIQKVAAADKAVQAVDGKPQVGLTQIMKKAQATTVQGKQSEKEMRAKPMHGKAQLELKRKLQAAESKKNKAPAPAAGSPEAHDGQMHADMAAHGKKTDAPESVVPVVKMVKITKHSKPPPAPGSPEAHDAQKHADIAAHGKKTDAPDHVKKVQAAHGKPPHSPTSHNRAGNNAEKSTLPKKDAAADAKKGQPPLRSRGAGVVDHNRQGPKSKKDGTYITSDGVLNAGYYTAQKEAKSDNGLAAEQKKAKDEAAAQRKRVGAEATTANHRTTTEHIAAAKKAKAAAVKKIITKKDARDKKDAKGQKPNQSGAEDTKQSEIKNHTHLKHRAAQVAKATHAQSTKGKKDPAVEKKMEKDVLVASAANQKAAIATEKAVAEHKTAIQKEAAANKAAKAGDVKILTPPNVKSKNVNQKTKEVEELNSSELGSDVAAIIGFD